MIWLVGAQGMLGQEIAGQLENMALSYIGTDKELDITDPDALKDFISAKSIEWIINCAAYTAVDKAEQDSDLAALLNTQGIENLGAIAHSLDARIIHISTDYVFNGLKNSPYLEDDSPDPQSVYGRTKYQGEISLQKMTDKYFIIRTSWLYGKSGPNFVKTMLRLMREKPELSVVNDQKGTPTYALYLALNILKIIQDDIDKYGVYHYSDAGETNWQEFALEIQSQALKAGLLYTSIPVKGIPTTEYPTPAQRPAYSVFDKSKCKKLLGFTVNDWKTNLEHFIKTNKEIL